MRWTNTWLVWLTWEDTGRQQPRGLLRAPGPSLGLKNTPKSPRTEGGWGQATSPANMHLGFPAVANLSCMSTVRWVSG